MSTLLIRAALLIRIWLFYYYIFPKSPSRPFSLHHCLHSFLSLHQLLHSLLVSHDMMPFHYGPSPIFPFLSCPQDIMALLQLSIFDLVIMVFHSTCIEDRKSVV